MLKKIMNTASIFHLHSANSSRNNKPLSNHTQQKRNEIKDMYLFNCTGMIKKTEKSKSYTGCSVMTKSHELVYIVNIHFSLS